MDKNLHGQEILTPSEAQEAELAGLLNAQGPPQVSEWLADYIWDNLPREDFDLWKRLAHASRNDQGLAELLIERERLLSKLNHPSATPETSGQYEAQIRQRDDRIELREQQLDQSGD